MKKVDDPDRKYYLFFLYLSGIGTAVMILGAIGLTFYYAMEWGDGMEANDRLDEKVWKCLGAFCYEWLQPVGNEKMKPRCPKCKKPMVLMGKMQKKHHRPKFL